MRGVAVAACGVCVVTDPHQNNSKDNFLITDFRLIPRILLASVSGSLSRAHVSKKGRRDSFLHFPLWNADAIMLLQWAIVCSSLESHYGIPVSVIETSLKSELIPQNFAPEWQCTLYSCCVVKLDMDRCKLKLGLKIQKHCYRARMGPKGISRKMVMC